MKKPCVHCSIPTNRYDQRCANCYYDAFDSDNPQSPVEALTIKAQGYTCACGETRTRVLILMCKGAAFLQPGAPQSNRPNPRDKRAFQVADDPSLWFVVCYNCRIAKTNRNPGRPKKYTDEERKWNRTNYSKVYKATVHTKAIQSYGINGSWPNCVMCDQPATRILYTGEFGKGPQGNHYWRCRRLAISDPYWHNQFLPYCDGHEVMNIGQRKVHKQRLFLEELAETNYKASRTFADLQQAGVV